MPHTVIRRLAGLCLGTLAVATAVPALAADLGYPPYPGIEPQPGRVYREERVEEEVPPPPRRPVPYGPRFVAGPYDGPPPAEECRTIVKHRIDAYGDEVERRVRICDERPAPRFRPSFYRPHPVPPADIPDEPWDGPPRW
ncbi:hypothetical protein [Methylobacterium gnaphalii]|uniref:Uncharacterized protein n=1 Tax=Methylobacterium gnaphalii TaxID=1010610 RepID=A0A512JQX9_9HYPH|nr:hypothetical protein [Methylobacterium gnaphalii]GEP12349.1 hypothetical protein MGN01_41940 [Methylobacterium gnaphalii]GJD69079.1 hypothetical protein MMMDOFMJ_2005 [Methylobacterium gnaphalii]GLS48560.1 hypothetical protein GCM10007885_14040 [Methylobacterium gnaphalii]